MIVKKKLADAVVEEIKRMLENGELKVGDKLPNQNEFANQLQVSRTSLREALRILDLRGAIEQRPGYGTVIKTYNPVHFSDSVVVPPLMSDAQGTIELIKARQIIEVGAAGLAALDATDDQIAALSGLTDQLNLTIADQSPDVYIKTDLAFHTLVAEMSNNRFVKYSFENLKEYIKQYMYEFFNTMPGLFPTSAKFHRKIYNAISKRDPAASENAMNKHLEAIYRNYLLFMEDAHPPD